MLGSPLLIFPLCLPPSPFLLVKLRFGLETGILVLMSLDQAQWQIPIIPELGQLKKDNNEFKGSLGYKTETLLISKEKNQTKTEFSYSSEQESLKIRILTKLVSFYLLLIIVFWLFKTRLPLCSPDPVHPKPVYPSLLPIILLTLDTLLNLNATHSLFLSPLTLLTPTLLNSDLCLPLITLNLDPTHC